MSIKFLLPLPLLTACLADEPAVDVTTTAINGDNVMAASQYQLDRAISLGNCTATRISRRWAITAAHCQPMVGQNIELYTTGPGSNSDKDAQIAQVVMRPGVNGAVCAADDDPNDCYDSSGRFADVALIRLVSNNANDENDLDGQYAPLEWEYPYATWGRKVGRGLHDGESNDANILLQHADTIESGSDADGQFHTSDDHTDDGDSGGPFYVDGRIVGVLWGSSWTLEDGYINLYTSIEEHLPWILSTIGYRWSGQPPQSNTLYAGTEIGDFFGSELECQYACETTTACEAYNWNTDPSLPLEGNPGENPTCILYDNLTSVTNSSTWKGALKHGARQNSADDVDGYVRGDGKDAVIHVGTDGHIHEIVRVNGVWQAHDLHAATGAPPVSFSKKVSAYRRADNRSVVVYRSYEGRVIELSLPNGGSWTANDLTGAANAELAAGSPVGYVKGDGTSAVVYRGTSGRMIELRHGSYGWLETDLMAVTGSSTLVAGDPSVFVRSDNVSSVVFRSTTGAVMELAQGIGGTWVIGSPSTNAGAPAAASRPYGFTMSSGSNAIVYRTAAGQVIQLRLGGNWTASTLATSGATGDPSAYTRTDATEAVLYRSTANRIIEIANGTTGYDLTLVTGAAAAASSPIPYHRADGHNVVLFDTAANHSVELYFKRGGTWGEADLTAVSGETP